MPRLTSSLQGNNAIRRLPVEATQRSKARHTGVSRQAISALLVRLNTTQSVNDRSRSSCHKVTTVAQGRYIRVRHLRNGIITAATRATQIPGLRRISDYTVRNTLRRQEFSLEDITF